MESPSTTEIVFRFRRPSGAAKRHPSAGIRQALQRLSETDEMQRLIADARAQGRHVVVEVFHPGDYGHPLLIHTAAVAPKSYS